jgi:hypothetical protein
MGANSDCRTDEVEPHTTQRRSPYYTIGWPPKRALVSAASRASLVPRPRASSRAKPMRRTCRPFHLHPHLHVTVEPLPSPYTCCAAPASSTAASFSYPRVCTAWIARAPAIRPAFPEVSGCASGAQGKRSGAVRSRLNRATDLQQRASNIRRGDELHLTSPHLFPPLPPHLFVPSLSPVREATTRASAAGTRRPPHRATPPREFGDTSSQAPLLLDVSTPDVLLSELHPPDLTSPSAPTPTLTPIHARRHDRTPTCSEHVGGRGQRPRRAQGRACLEQCGGVQADAVQEREGIGRRAQGEW